MYPSCRRLKRARPKQNRKQCLTTARRRRKVATRMNTTTTIMEEMTATVAVPFYRHEYCPLCKEWGVPFTLDEHAGERSCDNCGAITSRVQMDSVRARTRGSATSPQNDLTQSNRPGGRNTNSNRHRHGEPSPIEAVTLRNEIEHWAVLHSLGSARTTCVLGRT